MAWPLTPLRTFIANSVPVIDAAFLNLVQDWVNDLSEGVISIKGAVIDAVGGVASVGIAGTLRLAGAVGSRVAAGALKIPSGVVYRDGLVHGWGVVDVDVVTGAATVIRNYNVASVGTATVGATKVYEVIFNSVVDDPEQACVLITPRVSGDSPVILTTSDDGGGLVKVTFQINNDAGASVWAGFNILCLAH